MAARGETALLANNVQEKDNELRRADAVAREWQAIELRLREEVRKAKEEAAEASCTSSTRTMHGSPTARPQP